MTQLVKFDRQNSIARYNQGGGDRLTADKDESLLGHCIEERGWSLERTIQNLKPISKYEATHTNRAARIGKITAVAGFVVGLVGGGTVGAIGMLPLAGAALAAYVWQTAAACIPRRDLEYNLLKICPQIPEIMLACHTRGASPEVIVSAWDLLLDSYAESDGANAELVVLEFARLLDHVGRVPGMGSVADQVLPPGPTPPTIGTQTRLGAIAVSASNNTAPAILSTPAPSAQPSPMVWDEDIEILENPERFNWMDDLLSYPSVLIYGAPGAGKSTFAEWLVNERQTRGHKLEILDPHRAYGQWDGLPTFGDGMDYQSIDDRLRAFANLVEARYTTRSQKPTFNPQPITVLAEEFTQWAKKCAHSAAFFEMSVSDIRKVAMHVVYVSHGRTLTTLGGAKGLADTRDKALLELELLAQVDPTTGKASPLMRGLLKYPGRAPVPVAIPDLEKKSTTKKPECSSVAAIDEMETEAELTPAHRILKEAIALQTMQGRAK